MSTVRKLRALAISPTPGLFEGQTVTPGIQVAWAERLIDELRLGAPGSAIGVGGRATSRGRAVLDASSDALVWDLLASTEVVRSVMAERPSVAVERVARAIGVEEAARVDKTIAVIVHLAAELTLNPLLSGTLMAMRRYRVDLRFDLRTVGTAVLAWSDNAHPALSKCLWVVRPPQRHGFGPLDRFVAEVLRLNVPEGAAGFDEPTIESVAERISDALLVASARRRGADRSTDDTGRDPGTRPARYMAAAVEALLSVAPHWYPERDDDSVRSRIAGLERQAAGMVRDAIVDPGRVGVYDQALVQLLDGLRRLGADVEPR